MVFPTAILQALTLGAILLLQSTPVSADCLSAISQKAQPSIASIDCAYFLNQRFSTSSKLVWITSTIPPTAIATSHVIVTVANPKTVYIPNTKSVFKTESQFATTTTTNAKTLITETVYPTMTIKTVTDSKLPAVASPITVFEKTITEAKTTTLSVPTAYENPVPKAYQSACPRAAFSSACSEILPSPFPKPIKTITTTYTELKEHTNPALRPTLTITTTISEIERRGSTTITEEYTEYKPVPGTATVTISTTTVTNRKVSTTVTITKTVPPTKAQTITKAGTSTVSTTKTVAPTASSFVYPEACSPVTLAMIENRFIRIKTLERVGQEKVKQVVIPKIDEGACCAACHTTPGCAYYGAYKQGVQRKIPGAGDCHMYIVEKAILNQSWVSDACPNGQLHGTFEYLSQNDGFEVYGLGRCTNGNHQITLA